MAGTCEYGDEPSGSIKCGEFLDQLQNQSASQEGLCSMEQASKSARCVVTSPLIRRIQKERS